tara:strand:+ start:283 stop:513 length:231 start_codon:yes stop_codon:yes gene_type:complete
MKANLPPAPAKYEPDYFIRAFAAIDRIFSRTVSTIEVTDSILLQSPNGSVYKVTVGNTGTLTTTLVPLGQIGAPNY